MLLAIDVGNTNTVFAVYDGERQRQSWRCKTDSGRTADEYAGLMRQLFVGSDLAFKDITAVLISSVVPDANTHLYQFSQEHLNVPTHIVGYEDIPMEIKTNKPEEVGADRLVNALAVINYYKTPAVVVDFGTATTFDVVDENGVYCGGVIAPGVNLSMDALHAAAAKLPKVSIERPQNVIGRETESAMQSGMYWGYLGLIEGTLGRIAKEMKCKPFVIATGGLASLFSDGTILIEAVDEDLTLKGLVKLHDIQAKRKAA